MSNKQALSHRERVRLALEHRETDRVPIAMICSGINPPARVALEEYLERERGIDVATYLRPLIDVRQIGPRYIGPRLAVGTDIWGVHRSPASYGAGSYDEIDHYPLAAAQTVEEVHAYQWPTTDLFDYSVMPERIAQADADGQYCLMIANGNVFESAWYLRGFERIFMDLAMNPEVVHAIVEHVEKFFEAHFRKTLEASRGRIDLVFTADDIGGQNGLLMSLPMWEEFIKPYHMRVNRVIHEFDTKVIYHSDGSVIDAVPGLIDMGIDVLQALQLNARGMDAAVLKNKYGKALCFEGGVSVQKTLPFGSVQDVRAEVQHLVSTLGRGGGYILGPSHSIQAGTPPENIVAMFDAADAQFQTHRE